MAVAPGELADRVLALLGGAARTAADASGPAEDHAEPDQATGGIVAVGGASRSGSLLR